MFPPRNGPGSPDRIQDNWVVGLERLLFLTWGAVARDSFCLWCNWYLRNYAAAPMLVGVDISLMWVN